MTMTTIMKVSIDIRTSPRSGMARIHETAGRSAMMAVATAALTSETARL
jgi:hypothetical protein